jgi:N-dimethylarginine dimethylaminohydrolase
MTEAYSDTLTRYNVRLCGDGYHIVDEEEIIVSDAFRTEDEAVKELEKWLQEQLEDEAQQRHNDALYAHACGYHD